MHLSLHIAQGDAGCVAGKTEYQRDTISLNRSVLPAIAAWAYHRNTERSNEFMDM